VYKGVIMIDSNSLYESLMPKLQIFVDRCASSRNHTELGTKVDIALPEEIHSMPIGAVF
jgi:hypothetical protein